MRFRTLLAAAALAGTTHAQAEDIPDTQRLDVAFGPRPIHAPGVLMHPGYMSNTPNISTPSWPPSLSTALFFMVDLDWPLDSKRVQRLHWLATHLTLSNTPPTPDANLTAPLSIPDPHVVPYLPPAPPVGDVAHSYAFYLFGLPAGFQLPSQYTGLGAGDALDEDGTLIGGAERAPFDVEQFLRDCGLREQDVLARNHVRVRNLAGHPTITYPPARQATGALEDVVVPERNAVVGTGGVAGCGTPGLGMAVAVGVLVSVAAVLL